MNPSIDFETYSEAGYQRIEREWTTPKGKHRCETVWTGAEPGSKKNGLPLVGARNYVEHPTFEILCLAYDMFDVRGPQLWLPGCPDPDELLHHVARGGLLTAWNSSFEWQAWNLYCVIKYGWPTLLLSQMRCSMARSAANGYPRGLDDCGEVLSLQAKRAAPGVFSNERPNNDASDGGVDYDDDIPF